MMGTPRLLVVDDHVAPCAALSKLFGRRGWDVRVAHSVAEALRLLADAFDCIILELRLPDGSGEEILQAVEAHRLGTRVVVLSLLDEDRLKAVRDRFRPTAVLRKPVDVTALEWACGSKRRAPT